MQSFGTHTPPDIKFLAKAQRDRGGFAYAFLLYLCLHAAGGHDELATSTSLASQVPVQVHLRSLAKSYTDTLALGGTAPQVYFLSFLIEI